MFEPMENLEPELQHLARAERAPEEYSHNYLEKSGKKKTNKHENVNLNFKFED